MLEKMIVGIVNPGYSLTKGQVGKLFFLYL